MRCGALVLALLTAPLLVSCAPAEKRPEIAGPGGASATTGGTGAANVVSPFAAPGQTASGRYFVVLTPRPDPIPLNAIFSIDVAVYTDKEMKLPAAGTTVLVDAAMPSHKHGMNLMPRVTKVGEGRFRVEGMLMHMPGPWEVYADVRTDGGEADRARFELDL